MLRLIYQSHGNFCDPVLFYFFLLIILKFKTWIHIIWTSWARYTSPACSNLAQEFSVPSTVICRKEAWTQGLDHVYSEVFCRLGSTLGPGFITMKPKISRFVTNKGSRQEKLCSQNLDETCLKRRYSVYLFETTTQGSVLKVLWQKPAETNVKVTFWRKKRKSYLSKKDFVLHSVSHSTRKIFSSKKKKKKSWSKATAI